MIKNLEKYRKTAVSDTETAVFLQILQQIFILFFGCNALFRPQSTDKIDDIGDQEKGVEKALIEIDERVKALADFDRVLNIGQDKEGDPDCQIQSDQKYLFHHPVYPPRR